MIANHKQFIEAIHAKKKVCVRFFEHMLGFASPSNDQQGSAILVNELVGSKKHGRSFLATALFILGAEIDRENLMSFMLEQGLFGMQIVKAMLRSIAPSIRRSRVNASVSRAVQHDSNLPPMFPFRVDDAEGHNAPACAAMEKFAVKIHRFILQHILANSVAAARIPLWPDPKARRWEVELRSPRWESLPATCARSSLACL